MRQNRWLAEELEQGVLCADKVFVAGYHAWFIHDINEDDRSFIVYEWTCYFLRIIRFVVWAWFPSAYDCFG